MQQQGEEKREEGWGSYNVADNFYISKQEAKHHIRTFNQSAAIGFLPALRDAAYCATKDSQRTWVCISLYYFFI